MTFTLTQNEVAFFINYASGKVEAFETESDRARVIDEIEADNTAWAVA